MPPGKTRTQVPARVIEKMTAEACLALAQRVQHARKLSGDEAGSEAAGQVAQLIREGLLALG